MLVSIENEKLLMMKTLKPLIIFLFGMYLSNQTYGQECIDSTLFSNSLCTEEYDPVCGCDQVTYSNACIATNYYGVSSYTQGPCDPTSCQAAFNYADSACFVEFYGSGASSYEWYFGDGTSDQGLYTFHNYANSGLYTICMYAYDGQGLLCDTVCQEIYVQGCGQSTPCGAGFQTQGGEGCTMWFYAYGANSYEWQFEDDNSIENGSIVNHSFAQDGSYWVLMLAYDGQNQLCDSIYQYVTVSGCDSTSCIDNSLINYDIICSTEVDPVCGCDQVTYSNACTAQYVFGITSYTQGSCNQSSCDAGFQFSFDGNCGYTFYAYGAEDYEWWYDDMVYSGESVTLYISPNEVQDICMYAYDAQGVLCDTVCEPYICNLSGIDTQARLPLTVYPNPSNDGQFTIDFDGVLNEVYLVDLYGRSVDCPIDIETGFVDGSHLKAGKYFLNIQTNNQSYFEQILILQ
jgi:hypothetical protein